MQKAWCKETCWEKSAKHYDEKSNPAMGQCLVSVLVGWAEDDFKDYVVPALAWRDTHPLRTSEWHFQLNRIIGSYVDMMIDPTIQQYSRGTTIEILPRLSPFIGGHERHMKIVYGSFFEPEARESLERRLKLFIDRLESEGGYKTKHSASDILAKLDEVFSYAKTPPSAVPETAATSVPSAGL